MLLHTTARLASLTVIRYRSISSTFAWAQHASTNAKINQLNRPYNNVPLTGSVGTNNSTSVQPNKLVPKSASHWGPEELAYFRIRKQTGTIHEVFGLKKLPLRPKFRNKSFSKLLESDIKLEEIDQEADMELFLFLEVLCGMHKDMTYPPGTIANCLTESLFIALGVTGGKCHARLGFPVWLKFGPDSKVRGDLPMGLQDFDMRSWLLVATEDKPDTKDPFAQLMAQVIAAGQENWRLYEQQKFQTPFGSFVMPCIIMNNSFPHFYRVVVTPELLDSVATNRTPTTETIAFEYVPDKIHDPDDGLWKFENRQAILCAFEGFKNIIPKCHHDIPRGWPGFLSEEELVNLKDHQDEAIRHLALQKERAADLEQSFKELGW